MRTTLCNDTLEEIDYRLDSLSDVEQSEYEEERRAASRLAKAMRLVKQIGTIDALRRSRRTWRELMYALDLRRNDNGKPTSAGRRIEADLLLANQDQVDSRWNSNDYCTGGKRRTVVVEGIRYYSLF